MSLAIRFRSLVQISLMLTSCSDSPAAGAAAKEKVTFVVVAEARLFDGGSVLRARLWSAEQLATLDSNARCSVTHDPETGADEILCPDGVVYEEVVPEEATAPVEGSLITLEFASERVTVGDRFRLAVTGPSPDGCNTTSSQVTATADSPKVVLSDLGWETTLRGCATG
jgi:hypothetical protein